MFKYIKPIPNQDRAITYLGTYQKEDEENALKELAQLKLIIRRLNKILKYEGITLHFKCRGRRGKNNTHPYFKDHPKVGHYDGSTPVKYAQRVDVYLNTVTTLERERKTRKLRRLNYKVIRASHLVEELKNIVCEDTLNI
tara:strand:+ start:158 stop:577 length:420 start_codon:yes stop_codon:yes gene_type:complete